MTLLLALLVLLAKSFHLLLAQAFLFLAQLLVALPTHLFLVVDAVEIRFVRIDQGRYSSILRTLVVGFRITPSICCSGTGIS